MKIKTIIIDGEKYISVNDFSKHLTEIRDSVKIKEENDKSVNLTDSAASIADSAINSASIAVLNVIISYLEKE